MEGDDVGRVIVSVKGGVTLNPGMVRDLKGSMNGARAEMGVLVTLEEPTPGMVDAANRSGHYTWPVNGASFPKVQILTVRELLDGKRVDMPTPLMPYVQARRHVPEPDQLSLESA
jgi:hypothetical protein